MSWLVCSLLLSLLSLFCTAALASPALSELRRLSSLGEDSEEVASLKRALPLTLYRCATDTLTHAHDNCSVARFLWQHWRRTDASLAETESVPAKERTVKIESLSEDTPYSSVFENYELKQRVFKKKWSVESSLSTPLDWSAVSEEVFTLPWMRALSLPLSHTGTQSEETQTDAQASLSLLSLSLPAIASNSYARRLSPSLRERLHTLLPETCVHAPCVLSLADTHTTTAHTCPFNAHALLWRAPSSHNAPTQDRAEIALHVIEKTRHNHFALRPRVVLNITESDVLSYYSFERNVDSERDTHTDTNKESVSFDGKRGHTTLAHNEWAFVPHNYYFSLSRMQAHAEKEDVLLLCVVDASNMRAFASSLSHHTTLSHTHTQLFREISAKSFDYSMEKSPTEKFTLAEYHGVKTGEKEKKEGEVKEEAQESQETTKNTRNRKNRKNRQASAKTAGKTRKNDFQVWQDAIHWKALIETLSLTALPVASLRVSQVLRESVVLSYTPARTPVSSDQTAFGFRVELCTLPTPTHSHSQSPSQTSRNTDTDAEVEIETEDETRESVVWPVMALVDEDFAVELGGESGDIAHFLPFSMYSASPNASSNTLPQTTQTDNTNTQRCTERIILRTHKLFTETPSSIPYHVSGDEKEDRRLGVDSEGVAQYVKVSLPLSSLSSATFYQLRVSTIYGDKYGQFSAFSPVFRTLALTVPSRPLPPLRRLLHMHTHNEAHVASQITAEDQEREKYMKYLRFYSDGRGVPRALFALPHNASAHEVAGTHVDGEQFASLGARVLFGAPKDDGGFPIIGYAVLSRVCEKESRTHTSQTKQQWTWRGVYAPKRTQEGDLYVVVNNLIADVCYEFKVAAVNARGLSLFSVPSVPVRVSDLSEKTHSQSSLPLAIFGEGFKLGYGSLTEKALLTSPSLIDTLPPTLARTAKIQEDVTGSVYIDTRTQTISVLRWHDRAITFSADKPIPVWRSHWTSPSLTVLANTSLLYSQSHTPFAQRIAFLPRGGDVPLYELALRAQREGAVAAVIVDMSSSSALCDRAYDQRCVPGAQKERGEGFAMQDMPSVWSDVRIPVVLLSSEGYHALLENIDRALKQRQAVIEREREAQRGRDEL